MINIENIREKLENLLNGKDLENIDVVSPNNEEYYFSVASEGFELKNIYDFKLGKNFVPVFISSAGGEINPIPDLQDRSLNIQIAMYFPVRHKDFFYTTMSEFLEKTFVGKVLSYNGQKALSNISVPTYAEIETAEVGKFENFIRGIYLQPIKVSEQWMAMNFVLYLNQIGEDFIFGNEVEAYLSYTLNDIEYTDKVVFEETAITVSSSSESEQLLGENETKSVLKASTYASGFAVYVKNNEFYRTLIEQIAEGNAQVLQPKLRIVLPNFLSYTRECVFPSLSVSLKKGNPLIISFNIVSRKV